MKSYNDTQRNFIEIQSIISMNIYMDIHIHGKPANNCCSKGTGYNKSSNKIPRFL